MHFWIDKRSQACGFGRARVSASLSGAGSGVGLGFAHPPRRIGGNKSFSSVPSIHRQQHGQQNQQHHHNHHHQQQQQQQQHQQSAPYSNSSSVITTTADCHARNYNQQHGMTNNNNISAHNSSNMYAQHQQQQQHQQIQSLGTQQQSLTHNMNNNAHQQQQQILQRQQLQQQQISTCPINVGNNIGTYNILNNNNNNTSNTSNLAQLPPTTSAVNVSSATAAVLTGAGTIVPVTTSNANGRYGRHQYRSTQYPAINQMSNHAAHHHYDTRSYHHPQFGNMSVRHYQCGDNNATQMNATTTVSTTLQQTSNLRAIGNHPQFSAIGSNSVPVTTAAASSAMALHECRNGTIHQQQQNLHSPLQHVCGIPQTENIDAAGTMVLGPMHTRTLHSHQHATTHRNISSGNMRATITHNGIIDDAETQPILTQLKCGMWASLVLVSVFVAGAKFYFDNQGTGLEVIIFCAFSATFFLAACTVSLCRLPKGLVTARHMGDNSRALMPCNQAGFGASGTTVPPTGNTHNHIFGQSNDQRLNELQERTAAAQAGPPPYHIAILLPEHSKDAVTDESPPPSYDKILI